jgi:predicted phosphodiesterase
LNDIDGLAAGGATVRLGLVTDIHEAVDPLKRALAEFRLRGVDLVITLGDACENFSPVSRTDETAGLLREAGAVGVWGNHDVGLCSEVSERIRKRAAPATLEYMATLHPQMVVAGCRFSHVEPWLDANVIENLWYHEGPPDTPEKAGRSFAAVPERVLFTGHLHRWLVMTPSARIAWDGETPLELTPETRHLVVLAPVVSGWCAVYDTETSRLTPIRCGVESP